LQWFGWFVRHPARKKLCSKGVIERQVAIFSDVVTLQKPAEWAAIVFVVSKFPKRATVANGLFREVLIAACSDQLR
jgi:hypothetical protein